MENNRYKIEKAFFESAQKHFVETMSMEDLKREFSKELILKLIDFKNEKAREQKYVKKSTKLLQKAKSRSKNANGFLEKRDAKKNIDLTSKECQSLAAYNSSLISMAHNAIDILTGHADRISLDKASLAGEFIGFFLSEKKGPEED